MIFNIYINLDTQEGKNLKKKPHSLPATLLQGEDIY